jgi:hypothetical protein
MPLIEFTLGRPRPSPDGRAAVWALAPVVGLAGNLPWRGGVDGLVERLRRRWVRFLTWQRNAGTEGWSLVRKGPYADDGTGDRNLSNYVYAANCRPPWFDIRWTDPQGRTRTELRSCERDAVCPFCYARKVAEQYRAINQALSAARLWERKDLVLVGRTAVARVPFSEFTDADWRQHPYPFLDRVEMVRRLAVDGRRGFFQSLGVLGALSHVTVSPGARIHAATQLPVPGSGDPYDWHVVVRVLCLVERSWKRPECWGEPGPGEIRVLTRVFRPLDRKSLCYGVGRTMSYPARLLRRRDQASLVSAGHILSYLSGPAAVRRPRLTEHLG